MTFPRAVRERLYVPRYLAGAAVLLGWLGVYYAFRRHWLGIALPVLTTGLALLALRRGRELARRQRESLHGALETADARNRELERLGAVTGVMLQEVELHRLFKGVADAARELLDAEGAMITLLAEEGRFLRIAATAGSLGPAHDQLLPTDGSLAGWVVHHDEPLVCADLASDPRTARAPGLPPDLRNAAIHPLRAAGVPIGTISVVNRPNGRPFGDHDLQLLRALAAQAVVALERAKTFEEIRCSERELSQKNLELQRATRLKSEFLANMSHELRTPLNAIIGFSELILLGGAGDVPDQQRDFLEAVLRNGRHLLGLINSVLDLSKIEAGRMVLSLAATDLKEAITGAVADTASLRTARRQDCQVELSDAPGQIVADGVRVRQVLFNLLSNASKFTPDEGKITLTATRTRVPLPVTADRVGDEPQLTSRDAVWIAVSDTGVGIRPEDMEKLFQEFSQVDSSAGRRQQGTGLGLALSRRFVDLHGGRIGAESVPGRGSTFWFILPVDGPVRRSAPRPLPA